MSDHWAHNIRPYFERKFQFRNDMEVVPYKTCKFDTVHRLPNLPDLT